MTNQLPKTRAAITAYYADIPRRDALWVCASTTEDLAAAQDADDAALLALRTVFAEETREYNANLIAMSATAREIRLAVGFSDGEASAALMSAFNETSPPASNKITAVVKDEANKVLIATYAYSHAIQFLVNNNHSVKSRTEEKDGKVIFVVKGKI